MAKCVRCGNKGFGLKVNGSGLCFNCLEKELRETNDQNVKLQSVLTPEIQAIADKKAEIKRLELEYKNRNNLLSELEKRLATLQKEILVAEETIEMESFSLYSPRYNFANSELYKAKLDEVRAEEKRMIKDKTAATCSIEWTVNGSKSEGKKQTSDMIKLFLRAFNNECDMAVADAKFNNFDRCVSRIKKSYETINNLGRINKISISTTYGNLKLSELQLAYEYSRKKQEEKEEQAEIRRQQREQAKLEKEIAEARKAAEKERQHYEQALASINAQILSSTDDAQRAALEEKKHDIMNGLDDVAAKLEDIDYRQSNQRAGYVYIISNIGAFGPDVYKIGMTRRLNPMERVDELGDASVPFYFDVHAMIFSADAPALEAALHRAFESRRLNKVNRRREYFRVSLNEIKEVVRKNHDQTVEFIDIPAAEQYRESLRMN